MDDSEAFVTRNITLGDRPEDVHAKLGERAEYEHHQLAQKPLRITSEATSGETRASVMELHGLGRESWSGIDPQAYLDELRGTWN